LLEERFGFKGTGYKIQLKTSLSAGMMIYNLKKNLRIVGLPRHCIKPNARGFCEPLPTGKTVCHYANKYTQI